MLPQQSGGEMKKLFEDEDDMEETELFRTPIKSKKNHKLLKKKTFFLSFAIDFRVKSSTILR